MGGRVLVAGVGNVLRCDDGFGVAVVRRLQAEGSLPSGVDVIETGIGGLSIVQQLLDGYQALIVVDTVDRGEAAGQVFVLEPTVPAMDDLPTAARRALLSNLHLAEPSRVFALARALGVLPERTLLVGCQPLECEDLGETLTPPVQAAVAVAVREVRALVDAMVSDP